MSKIEMIFLIFAVAACKDAPKDSRLPEVQWTKEHSTDLGKNLAIQEEIDIQLFLEAHRDWKMIKTGSGLRFYIYQEGKGRNARSNDIAEIEFEIALLDGTVCYGTADDEYEEMVVDRSEIESGVQEALKLMNEGCRVKLITPSHIAHGLIGDQDKIPPLTPLVIDLHLLGIK